MNQWAAERCILMRRSAHTVKNPGRAREGRSPLELQSNPAACTPDSQQFLRRGACPPEKKLLPCSFRARKCAAFQRKLVGVAVAGELAPPATSLFYKLSGNGTRRSRRMSQCAFIRLPGNQPSVLSPSVSAVSSVSAVASASSSWPFCSMAVANHASNSPFEVTLAM